MSAGIGLPILSLDGDTCKTQRSNDQHQISLSFTIKGQTTYKY